MPVEEISERDFQELKEKLQELLEKISKIAAKIGKEKSLGYSEMERIHHELIIQTVAFMLDAHIKASQRTIETIEKMAKE